MSLSVRPAARIAAFGVLGILLPLAIACGGKKTPEAKLVDPKDVEVQLVGEVGTFTEPTIFEKGVGMHARATEDGGVVLSIRNSTNAPIDIGFEMFAVIKGPNRQRDLVALNATTADITMFYPETIPAGGKGVFRFSLKPAIPMQGKRIVLQEPNLGLLFFSDIE